MEQPTVGTTTLGLEMDSEGPLARAFMEILGTLYLIGLGGE